MTILLDLAKVGEKMNYGINNLDDALEFTEQNECGMSVTEALAQLMNYNWNRPQDHALGWAWNEAEAKRCRDEWQGS